MRSRCALPALADRHVFQLFPLTDTHDALSIASGRSDYFPDYLPDTPPCDALGSSSFLPLSPENWTECVEVGWVMFAAVQAIGPYMATPSD